MAEHEQVLPFQLVGGHPGAVQRFVQHGVHRFGVLAPSVAVGVGVAAGWVLPHVLGPVETPRDVVGGVADPVEVQGGALPVPARPSSRTSGIQPAALKRFIGPGSVVQHDPFVKGTIFGPQVVSSPHVQSMIETATGFAASLTGERTTNPAFMAWSAWTPRNAPS